MILSFRIRDLGLLAGFFTYQVVLKSFGSSATTFHTEVVVLPEQTKFKDAKCNALTFTHKANPLIFNYHMLYLYKDFGVTFEAKLIFANHILNTSSPSHRTLIFIIRNTRQFSNVDIIIHTYISICMYLYIVQII